MFYIHYRQPLPEQQKQQKEEEAGPLLVGGKVVSIPGSHFFLGGRGSRAEGGLEGQQILRLPMEGLKFGNSASYTV